MMAALDKRASATSTADHDYAREQVRALTRDSGTSFYWGMRALPADRRAGMFATYAFCRAIDDIADGDVEVDDKTDALEEWRKEIAALYEGRPHHPIAVALSDAVRDYGLREADFQALIDGMEMDANGPIVAPRLEELDLYCDRVASAVGRISVRIFGDHSEAAQRLAHHLGRALQLTNILRDLGEDAARGRLYLPEEWLDKHGVASREPQAVLADPAFGAVCADMAARARDHFRQAAGAMKECDAKAMRPARIMMAVYRRLLDKLEARGWDRAAQPVDVARAVKLWLAIRHGLF